MSDNMPEQGQQATRPGWPNHSIPIEIIDSIAFYLQRQDIGNLRLVNRELATKLESNYFSNSVVEFTPNFYLAQSQEDDDVGVFGKLGDHIRKFGVSFEFDETLMQNPPKKIKIREVKAIWGTYNWPGSEYFYFTHTKQLADLGDQHVRLRKAISKLTKLRELAICVNNGFGFFDIPSICPDIDRRPFTRGSAFKEGPVVFKTRHPTIKDKEYLFYDGVARSGSRVASTCSRELVASMGDGEPDSDNGVSLFTDEELETKQYILALQPRSTWFTMPQVELFIETSWAIQAFLTSFVCAIADNGPALRNIRTLNFSCISSGLLHHFNRSEFFASFPNLSSITLMVVADWKSIEGTSYHLHPLTKISPTNAPLQLRKLLDDQIVHISTLRSLTLGYIGGGEYDTGFTARNKNILPAPVGLGPAFLRTRSWCMPKDALMFRHLKSLTFENCWFTPVGLHIFMKDCERTALENITFDSCSLAVSREHHIQHTRRNNWRPIVHPSQYYNQPVRHSTWASAINEFTPGRTIIEQKPRDTLYSEPPEEAPGRIHIPHLNHLRFISCGYAGIANIFSQNGLATPASGQPGTSSEGMTEGEDYFASYELLGTIVTLTGIDEQLLLKHAFGMTFGWGDDVLQSAVKLDAGTFGGEGRFSGSLRPYSGDNKD